MTIIDQPDTEAEDFGDLPEPVTVETKTPSYDVNDYQEGDDY